MSSRREVYGTLAVVVGLFYLIRWFVRLPWYISLPIFVGFVLFWGHANPDPPLRTNKAEVLIYSKELNPGSAYDPPSILLKVSSTLDRDYHTNAVICQISGPIYYYRNAYSSFLGGYPVDGMYGVTSRLIGQRRLLVAMYPAEYATEWWPDFTSSMVRAAAWTQAASIMSPREREINFRITTPDDVFTKDDGVDWCSIAENMNTLAASLHLSIDRNGVIANHVQWTSGGQAIAASGLQTNGIEPDMVAHVRAGYYKSLHQSKP
jgi:hypothetical protein